MIKKITLLMMLLPIFGFGQLATFNFFGATEVATWDASTVDANLNQTVTMSRGAGAAASAGSNSFRTTGFMNDGIAVTNTDYFQFQLEALAGFKMSLTSINAQVRGTATFATANSNGGVTNQFAYSLDGTTFTLIGAPLLVTSGNSALPTTDLSSVAALQNIAAGTVVTFRYYASGQTITGGWGFTSSSATVENFVVDGTSAAVGGNPCSTIIPPVAPGVSVCSGNTATLIATPSETGSTLSWFNVATGGVAVGTGLTFTTPTLTSSTSYWVEEALPGCPASARTEVIVNVSGVAPIVDAGADQTICAGTQISLTATGTGTFTWNNGVSQAVPFTPTTTTTYIVTVDDGVCTNTDTVTITVDQPSVAGTISASTLNACLNDVLTGSIAGNTGNVQWFAQGPGIPVFIPVSTGSTVTVPAAQAGTYSVKAQVTNGVCPSATTNILTIVVNPLPVVTTTLSGLTLTASLTGVDYEWFNCADNMVVGTNLPTYTATMNGSYAVEVTDANGCVGSSTCQVITTVGVENKTAINSFSMSPNPTKGKVTITAASNESANVVIFNALGKEVSRVSNIQNGSVIDFSAFNNGVYMVQITNNKGTKVQRVVKN